MRQRQYGISIDDIVRAEKRAIEMEYSIAVMSLRAETGINLRACYCWANCLADLHPDSILALTKGECCDGL